jgi:hypothetical protein
VGGELYVAYAPAGAPAARQSAPRGAGAVAVFDTSGNFIKQLISGGRLASPWGITLAPPSFGEFGGDLLVGNFSYVDTEINAFDPTSGSYLGTLTDGSGDPLLAGDNGLWDLTFGHGGSGGLRTTLYFTTGLNDETDGLFGAITPAPRPGIAYGLAGGTGGDLSVAETFQTAPPPTTTVWSSPVTAPLMASVPPVLPPIPADMNPGSITVNCDNKKEATEYFYLDLYDNSSNSLFTKNRGTGTILNDD